MFSPTIIFENNHQTLANSPVSLLVYQLTLSESRETRRVIMVKSRRANRATNLMVLNSSEMIRPFDHNHKTQANLLNLAVPPCLTTSTSIGQSTRITMDESQHTKSRLENTGLHTAPKAA